MKIPLIIHQFWAGPERPERVRELMISVRKHSLGWRIIVWNEDSVKDLGLNVGDLKHKCVNWAGVSNIVRLHAVYQMGGVWLDSDVELLKPLTPLLNHQAFAARQDTDRICNAIFGASQKHPWIKWQIDHQDRLLNEDAATGVYLMSEAPRAGLTILPTPWFYPFAFDAKPEARIPASSSFCVHWWDASWKK